MHDIADPARFERAQNESRILEHPAQFQAIQNLATLLDEVRRCYAPSQYRAVQQRLGAYIEHVDKDASSAKEEREQADDRFRRMGKRKLAVDEATLATVKGRREEAEFRRVLCQRLGLQYRAIGDAIAWQLYDFRSVSMYALGMNASPGPVAGK